VNAKLGRKGTPGEGEASSSKQLNPTRELLLSPLLNVILPCPLQHSDIIFPYDCMWKAPVKLVYVDCSVGSKTPVSS
ncbi:unnamed protein product, partial [Bubo scandiacus]